MFYCIYFFIIGAFMGWVLECLFKAGTKKFNNAPGILNSPFCILYGIGTVLLSTIIPFVTDNVFVLFFLSAIILTFCEYVTYILLRKMYGIALWNYSNMRLAISEKVCVEFAVIWGVLGVIYIKYLLPILKSVFISINGPITNLIILAIFTFISLDLLYSNERILKRQGESADNPTLTR